MRCITVWNAVCYVRKLAADFELMIYNFPNMREKCKMNKAGWNPGSTDETTMRIMAAIMRPNGTIGYSPAKWTKQSALNHKREMHDETSGIGCRANGWKEGESGRKRRPIGNQRNTKKGKRHGMPGNGQNFSTTEVPNTGKWGMREWRDERKMGEYFPKSSLGMIDLGKYIGVLSE